MRAALGHSSGSPENFWTTFFPLTLFLWGLDVRVTNDVDWRLAYMEVMENTLWS